MAHRTAQLNEYGWLLLARRVIDEGWTVPTAARVQGVSRATGYTWVGRYRTDGLPGLSDRSSRPRRSPNRQGRAVPRDARTRVGLRAPVPLERRTPGALAGLHRLLQSAPPTYLARRTLTHGCRQPCPWRWTARRRAPRTYIRSGAEIPSRPSAEASVTRAASARARRARERSGSDSSITRASR